MRPATTADRIEIEVHLAPGGGAAMAREVRLGLTARPKELPPKYFYDERGSELFELITELPEYYPTRAERAILSARSAEIVAAAGEPATLVELGSGSAAKTRHLLSAMRDAGRLETYVPVDISERITREAAERLVEEYPGLAVRGLVCDFEHDLELIGGGSDRDMNKDGDGSGKGGTGIGNGAEDGNDGAEDRIDEPGAGSSESGTGQGGRLVAFLGGTIGNLYPEARRDFLSRIAALLGPGDRLLLGTDLVKERARLEAAYDDAAGVTAAFNRNVLAVLNRELGADFDPDAFEHVARYDAAEARIDVRLRSRADQLVRVDGLDLNVRFAAGEEMRTEISAKFTRKRLEAIYAEAGLSLSGWFTDPAGDYALSLAQRD